MIILHYSIYTPNAPPQIGSNTTWKPNLLQIILMPLKGLESKYAN